ncbi:methyl-accepting chemotaxis protein [Herbaspirillum sp. alder98]|uniref:methyl-accepting chemotaxis protein n=1 Tax=Herbaspirillum sp. alder98 TaxID=2913096 RepID=UPI001CD8BA20|nr:methyl-accepting chemotaxis protein [Herbaspirillum sp. alder98]MCA1323787.1 methyl-accepting chemotaxis protein [Herbaspirillum sp. alder98]
MKNMKISTRLAACFTALIAVMCIITATGINSLWKVGESTSEIIDDRYVKISLLVQISDSVNTTARNLRNAMLAQTDEETQGYLGKIEKNSSEVTRDLAQIEKLLNSPSGVQHFKAVTEARAEYTLVRRKVEELIRQKQKEAAATYLLAEVVPRQDKYFEAIKEFVALQKSMMDASVEKGRAASGAAVMAMSALSGIAILLSALGALLVTRSITRPLNAAVEVASAVAAGDLTAQIDNTSKDETGLLLDALKTMNQNLHRIVSEVRLGTDTINTASGEIASGNLDLSTRTEQQASSLEETAAAMEELTSTVKQNADNARQANSLAETASSVALEGGGVVGQVVETMGQINDASKRIVDIISVIDGIAFQTNILALNAAVEAARAGEQGRGFAVVASEVRSLAQRSATAAREIKGLIDATVAKVDNGTRLVEQAGITMEEVVASVKRVSDVVAEISAASVEQSDGIEQINLAVTQMDEVTQQNAALVEEAAAAAQSLQEQSKRLTSTVSVFKLSI